MFRIDLSDIFYIEAQGDYIKIHTTARNLMVYDTLSGFEEKLPPRPFPADSQIVYCFAVENRVHRRKSNPDKRYLVAREPEIPRRTVGAFEWVIISSRLYSFEHLWKT